MGGESAGKMLLICYHGNTHHTKPRGLNQQQSSHVLISLLPGRTRGVARLSLCGVIGGLRWQRESRLPCCLTCTAARSFCWRMAGQPGEWASDVKSSSCGLAMGNSGFLPAWWPSSRGTCPREQGGILPVQRENSQPPTTFQSSHNVRGLAR